ncbi:MAG: response regulator [Candidatus Eremiobacteraeota bacterium]|nr:response regulator [Candidatus Eremiobacteraeota bacterium]
MTIRIGEECPTEVTALTAPIILVIDDDETSRKSVTRLLEREGYRVAASQDGREGLRLAVALQPDLILTDLVMPGMDGYELCRQLRAHDELSDIPIIIFTSNDDKDGRVLGLEAGADDFLPKPVEPGLLKARVRMITRLNRYRRIKAQRTRLTWVVENASEGYVLCNKEGLITFCNSRARELLNLPTKPDEFALYPHLRREFTLIPADEWRKWPYLDNDSKLELLRPETARLPACWLEVKVLTHYLGHDYEVLLRVADVTAEKNTQQSVWTFESLISHKLRTPLTKISWGVSFIQKKAEKLSTEQIKEFANQASGGVEDLKSVLEEILAYINAPTAVPGGHGMQLTTVTDTVQETAGLLGLSPVQLEPWSFLPPSVYLSKPAFEMICFELLQNSKKFHPDHNPHVTVNVSFENGFVHFGFTDDGTGLPPDQLAQAVKPYYQAEKGFSGQIPGMGLGLTMVCTMVQKVGGKVRLRNRSDRKGLVVEFMVPVARAD